MSRKSLIAVGAALSWNLGLGPRWYPISLILLAIPQRWAGGKIHGVITERK